ncbi:MAG: DNA primase [Pseudomonadota bacterium]
MRFTDGFLSVIRDRLPLSDIVGRRVSWDRRKSRPAKGDHWACCPFHGEKTPSFHVDDRRGRYHCFGCGASGDHFRFLMEHDGMSFPEAVELLAGEAGVAMPAPDPEAERRHKEQLKLHDILELAASFYERALHSQEGQHALAYAEGRGLDSMLRATFRIGYAPDGRTRLFDFLCARDVPLADMVETGLVIVPEEGGRAPYDRFRGRLMVAIEDQRGKVVGFGGRVLGDGEPKYLNSPETELFRKREMLFNSQRARTAAHQANRLVVVEGYMDAIALHKAGVPEVTASLGTALGEDQIALIWRFNDEPIICFDGDEAGTRAAHKAIDRVLPLLKPGKSLRFLFLPAGLDPDDFIKERGKEAFVTALDGAQSLIDALWERETSGLDLGTPERIAAFQASLGRLAAGIADEAVRKLYDQALKDRFYALRRALRQAQYPGGYPGGRPGASRSGTGALGASSRVAPEPLSVERQLLALARRFPSAAQRFGDRDIASLVSTEDLARQLEIALEGPFDDRDPGSAYLDASPAGDADVAVLRQDKTDDATALDQLPFPILKREPSPRFLDTLFACLLSKLELKAVEAEANEAQRASGNDLDEATMGRLLAIQDEARTMRDQINELERALDEEAALMRGASSRAS